MKTLDQHNREKMEDYGLDKISWQPSELACPWCLKPKEEKPGKIVEMLSQVGIVLMTHPPKKKVKCPECKRESYMYT